MFFVPRKRKRRGVSTGCLLIIVATKSAVSAVTPTSAVPSQTDVLVYGN